MKKRKKRNKQQNDKQAIRKKLKELAAANTHEHVPEETAPVSWINEDLLAQIVAEKLLEEFRSGTYDIEAADETETKEQDLVYGDAETDDNTYQKDTPKIDYISVLKDRLDDIWDFISETRKISVPLIIMIYTAIVVAITIPFEHARVLKEFQREAAELEQLTNAESSNIALEKDVETALPSGSKAVYTGYEFTDSVKARNSNEFGSTYESDSEVNTYLDIKLQYTHNGAEPLPADKVVAMTAKISGIQYSGFAAVETDGGQNIEFANRVEIAPGETVQMHYIFNVPKELEKSDENLTVDVALDKTVYVITVR